MRCLSCQTIAKIRAAGRFLLALTRLSHYPLSRSGGHLIPDEFMLRFFTTALVTLLISLTSAHAGDRTRIGYGRLITNDFIGDGKDRWRSGSVASSRVWGPEWSGQLPSGIGEIIELRLGAEIIAPENLTTFRSADRRYATSLSIGAHTHYLAGKTEVAAGVDLIFVGPHTGLSQFQRALHNALGVPEPDDSVLRNQVANSINPTVSLELGRSLDLSERTHVRPFVEARAGVETYMRAGFDLTFGALGRGELLTRDTVSGQRYRTIANDWTGLSAVFGADIAYVGSSVYFPETRGPIVNKTRERVRLGVHWQGKKDTAMFYGMTWLGEEFEGQDGGQLIGSARLNFRF